MRLFGYEREKKKKSLDISEASIFCSKEELEKIIQYLQSIREEIGEDYISLDEHWHYSDYNEDWTDKDSELIVFVDNTKIKGDN